MHGHPKLPHNAMLVPIRSPTHVLLLPLGGPLWSRLSIMKQISASYTSRTYLAYIGALIRYARSQAHASSLEERH